MRLQRLQNKAVKYIRQKPSRTPTVELYDNKFISFLELSDYEVILFIQKVKMGLIKCDVALNCFNSLTNRNTRQSSLLKHPHYMTAKPQKSLFYRGVSLFNAFSTGSFSKNTTSSADLKKLANRICEVKQ